MSVMRLPDLSELSAELIMKQVGSLHISVTAASNNRMIVVAFVLIYILITGDIRFHHNSSF